MIRVETSRHCDMAAHWIYIGRLIVIATNRPQLFEEKRLPKVRGWWVKVIWRKKARGQQV